MNRLGLLRIEFEFGASGRGRGRREREAPRAAPTVIIRGFPGRGVRPFPTALLVLLASGCITDSTGPLPTNPGPFQSYGFGPADVIDPAGGGTEPGLLATRDGSLYAVGVLGSATRRGDGVWKSTDGGKTWVSLGLPDYPFGGGDADLDEDDAGTLYLTGQWRPAAIPGYYVTGGESVAVSRDGGRSWSAHPIASDLPVTDRQWLATYKTGTVYLAFNQAQRGLVVTKSTDSGSSWAQLQAVPGTWEPGDGIAVQGGANGIPGDILVDPKDGTLLIPYATDIGGPSRAHRLFLSRDGVSFEAKKIHEAPAGTQASAIFGTLGLDSMGTLYYAWSEASRGVQRVFLRFSHDRGSSWSSPLAVTHANETAIFPWLVVGDPGKIAIAYYVSPGVYLSDRAPVDAEWHPAVTFFPNAFHGAVGAETHQLSLTANHKGPICTEGTNCDAQYRRLGDFFELALTREGHVVAVWADDTRMVDGQPLNMFARQTLGALL